MKVGENRSILAGHPVTSAGCVVKQMSRDPVAEQQARDKKMINQGLAGAKKLIDGRNFDDASRELSKIAPAVRRLNYRSYELALMQAALFTKQQKWSEARPFIQTATRLKPDEALPWIMFVRVDAELGNVNDLKATITRALQNAVPDKALLKEIAPHLKKLDDKEVVFEFMRVIKALPDGLSLNLANYLPENTDTLDMRLDMLRTAAVEDENACSDLIHLIINECPRPFEAMEWAKKLPEGHQDRLYVETLLGDDPLKSAQKHYETGSNRFRDFILAAKAHDLPKVKNEVSLIGSFISGWIFLAKQCADPKQRAWYLADAVLRYPDVLSLLKMLAEAKEESNDFEGALQCIKKVTKLDPEVGSPLLIRLLIRQGKVSDVVKMLQEDGDVQVSAFDRAVIELEMFKQDHDKDRLRRVLKMDNEESLAGAKAEAAWELRDELGDGTEQYFLDALKMNRNNGRAYLLFGKWMLERKGDEEKVLFLFEKSIECGEFDSGCCELLSRKKIEENKLDEALSLCLKVDNNWSHFRAGMIYQRRGEHEAAANELQLDLRFNPDRKEGWAALGHSYLMLGRILSAKSVAEQLREMNAPDIALEYEIATFSGKPIEYKGDLQIEVPNVAYAILRQIIAQIHQFKRIGRKQTCMELITNIEPSVMRYAEKWPNLASVLKICGDFECIVFEVSKKPEAIKNAVQFYQKRAEVDRRAEAFIDLARALHLTGDTETALSVLRRVVKVFSDHAGIWMNLGIAFALTSRFPFARHCLCVAAKLSTDTEASKAFSCCSAVAFLIHDDELLQTSLDAARRYNPYDPDVWKLVVKTDEASALDAALMAFELGSSENILQVLPNMCLRMNRLQEALGYALMSDDNETIAACFEANHRYDLALLYAVSDKTKERLSLLLEKEAPSPFNLYKDGKFDEAAAVFSKDTSVYGQIATGICLISSGKTADGVRTLEAAKQAAPFFTRPIDQILMKLKPADEDMESTIAERDPATFFLLHLRKCSRLEAADFCIKHFPSNPDAMEIYVSECLRDGSNDSITDFLVTKARLLVHARPSTKSSTLLVISLIRSRLWQEASHELQRLLVMSPSLYAVGRPLLTQVLAELSK